MARRYAGRAEFLFETKNKLVPSRFYAECTPQDEGARPRANQFISSLESRWCPATVSVDIDTISVGLNQKLYISYLEFLL